MMRAFRRLPGTQSVRGRRAHAGFWGSIAVLLAIVAWTAPVASAALTITVASTQPVYRVDAGGTANIGVRLSFTGTPNTGFTALDRAVVLTWTVGGNLAVGSGATLKTLPSTAVPGVDYTSPTSGTVTFPVNSPSGTVVTFPVVTAPNATPSMAKTINSTIMCTSGCTTVAVTSFTNDPPTTVINAHGFPYLDATLPIATRVADLLSRMSLADKVGQMTETLVGVVNNGTTTNASSWNNTRAWELGSVLSGGSDNASPNTPTGWADLIDNIQNRALATALQIPMIYGSDTVHGNQHIPTATDFPHNIGMGATRDPALSELEGEITAQETRSTGPQFGFAPCVCVARDDRWGRTYESWGEDPSLVNLMETEIDGMQGTNPLDKTGLHIIASAKHYAGDGATTYGAPTGTNGYKIDQGTDIMDSATFQRLALAPYVPAVQVHHVGSIMPSYSSVQLDGATTSIKMSADADLLTNVLKNQMGFDGFLISDYDAINSIPDTHTADGVADAYSDQILKSFNAGMDMVMAPGQPEFKNFENDLITLVNNGKVAQSRIDDAVSRILTQKFELGLFEHPLTDRSTQNLIGSAAHRAVARQAVAESQVLLKNDGVLPLSKTAHIYVAGSNGNNIGNQNGGWTVTWQGSSNNSSVTGTTIFQAIQADDANSTFNATASTSTSGYDAGVVVVGEHPYAEGQGDVGATAGTTNGAIANLDVTAADKTAIDRVCSAMPCVVLMVSGRPMTITDTNPLSEMNAIVASWLPGTEGGGVADVLFGDQPFTGQLPQSWPRTLSQEPINVGDPSYNPLFPFGWGLRTLSAEAKLQQTRDALAAIVGDAHVTNAVADLDQLLAADVWNADGSVADPGKTLSLIAKAAAELAATTTPPYPLVNGVVSVARDLAQAAVLENGGADSTTSPLIGNADLQLLTGHPDVAVSLLTQVVGDVTAPTVTIAVSPSSATGWWSQSPTVTVSADDGTGSGVASLQVKVDDGSWTAYSGPFQLSGDGQHAVLARATDHNGNVGNADPLSIGLDSVAPTTTVTPDRSPDHNGWYNAPVTFTASGDDGAGSGIASCTDPVTYAGPDSASAAPVTLTCTDLAGNSSDGSSGAFEYDATPPDVTVPADIVQEATGPTGAAVTYTASSSDALDGPLAVTCSPVSGSTFPLGHTQVQCSSTDQAGNIGAASFDVFVPDSTAPQVDPPANMVVEATGPAGAVATYPDATATDLVDGPLPATCSPVSGSTFALGNTHVACTATDSSGNVGSSSFDVLVVDTTAPVVSPHADVVVNATSSHGASVTFSVTAVDLVDGSVPATCAPASGSTFAAGHTTVVCSATDSHHNTGSTSFDVYVKGAVDQLADLETLVRSFHLNRWVEWDYRIMIQSVERTLLGRHPRTACLQLTVVNLLVRFDGGHHLTKAQSAQVVAALSRISAAAGC